SDSQRSTAPSRPPEAVILGVGSRSNDAGPSRSAPPGTDPAPRTSKLLTWHRPVESVAAAIHTPLFRGPGSNAEKVRPKLTDSFLQTLIAADLGPTSARRHHRRLSPAPSALPPRAESE